MIQSCQPQKVGGKISNTRTKKMSKILAENKKLEIQIIENKKLEYVKALWKLTIKESLDWVNALRSGKFTQGQGVLCAENFNHCSFCCLGVKAKLENKLKKIDDYYFFDVGNLPKKISDDILESKIALVDNEKMPKFGELPFNVNFTNDHGGKRKGFHSLSGINDAYGNFEQIAWVIEKLCVDKIMDKKHEPKQI